MWSQTDLQLLLRPLQSHAEGLEPRGEPAQLDDSNDSKDPENADHQKGPSQVSELLVVDPAQREQQLQVERNDGQQIDEIEGLECESQLAGCREESQTVLDREEGYTYPLREDERRMLDTHFLDFFDDGDGSVGKNDGLVVGRHVVGDLSKLEDLKIWFEKGFGSPLETLEWCQS